MVQPLPKEATYSKLELIGDLARIMAVISAAEIVHRSSLQLNMNPELIQKKIGRLVKLKYRGKLGRLISIRLFKRRYGGEGSGGDRCS